MVRTLLGLALSASLALPAAAQAPVEPSRIISSPAPSEYTAFGSWVAAIGDADGDTFRDLVVAAPFGSSGAYQSGRVYLISSTGGEISQVGSPQPVRDGLFGAAASFLGDLNGDNRRETVVGAPGEGPLTGAFETSDNSGRAYVLAGGSGSLLFTLVSPTPAEYGNFGDTVAGPGDVTGDGVPDIVVGAPREAGVEPLSGNAYVFSGADGTLVRTLASPTAREDGQFGDLVAAAGDLTGDGVPDILVTARNEGPPDASPFSRPGRVHLFSGATGAWVLAFDSGSETSAAQYGVAAVPVGDLDLDGTPDVAVGAFSENNNGRVTLFSGATGAILRTLDSSSPPQGGGGLGVAIAPAGDVDGDGVPDVLAGAPYEQGRNGVNRAGRVTLFSGATGAELLVLTSPTPALNSGYGRSVAWADIDGDGAPDPIVGAPREGAGRVYLYTSAQLRAALGGVVAAEAAAAEGAFALAVAPNPVLGLGAVSLRLDAAQPVRLAVVDALGREVAVLHDGPLVAGTHRLGLDTAGLPAGVYVVRAVGRGMAASQTLTVIR